MIDAQRIVVGDIGGTHARFAIATPGVGNSFGLSDPFVVATRDHVGFESAWAAFRDDTADMLPPALAIAVAAGPDPDGAIRFTNNDWVLRRDDLQRSLDLNAIVVVNDLEAVAYAVPRLSAEHFAHIAGPDRALDAARRTTVLGVGTGLGAAHLRVHANGTPSVSATEAGHIGFAPIDDLDDAILRRLRAEFSRVSAERVISGGGIVAIHAALAEARGDGPVGPTDIDIWTNGLDGSDPLAEAAIARFCLSLGSVAGDIALAQGGFGGMVIAGGLAQRLQDILPRSGFAERFMDKGRFASLMRDIPVKLMLHPQPGLLGAAAAFAARMG